MMMMEGFGRTGAEPKRRKPGRPAEEIRKFYIDVHSQIGDRGREKDTQREKISCTRQQILLESEREENKYICIIISIFLVTHNRERRCGGEGVQKGS